MSDLHKLTQTDHPLMQRAIVDIDVDAFNSSNDEIVNSPLRLWDLIVGFGWQGKVRRSDLGAFSIQASYFTGDGGGLIFTNAILQPAGDWRFVRNNDRADDFEVVVPAQVRLNNGVDTMELDVITGQGLVETTGIAIYLIYIPYVLGGD